MAKALSQQLCDYPVAIGYSRDSLTNTLCGLAWQDPNVVSIARRTVSKQADKAIQSWFELAKELDTSVEIVVRDLVASANKSDVIIYGYLFRYWKQREGDIPNWVFGIEKILPGKDRDTALLRILLLEEMDPSTRQIIDGLKMVPGAVFSALVLSVYQAVDAGPASAKLIYLDAIRQTPIKTLSAVSSVVNAMISTAETMKASEFIDQDALKALPKNVRQRLFASDPARLLFSRPLRDSLENDPWFHPDTPQSLARPKVTAAALRDIGRSDLSTKNIETLCLDLAFFKSRRQQLREALRGVKRLPSVSHRLSEKARESLLKLSAYPESVALLLLNRGAEEQPGSYDFISCYRTFLKGLSFLDNRVASSRLRRAPTELFVHWFKSSSVSQIHRVSDRVSDSDLMAKIATSFPGSKKLFDVVTQHPLSAQMWVSKELAQEIISSNFLERLETTGRADVFKPLVQQSVSQLRKYWNRLWNANVMEAIFRFDPKMVLGIIHKQSEKWELKKLVECAEDQPELLEEFFSHQPHPSPKLWAPYLEVISKTNGPVPISLRDWIESTPSRTKKAFKLAPLLFCDAMYEHYGTELVLSSALKNPAIARRLQGANTPESLRENIPYVRSKWRRRPWVAAAYELAVGFSLPHAGFLIRAISEIATKQGRKPGSRLDHLYRTYELPKDAGGKRIITVPPDLLKSFQRRVLQFGFNNIDLHPAATGFRPGISIRDNAQRHAGHSIIVNVDIESCFSSTGFHQVHKACRILGNGWLSKRAIFLLAELCSFQSALPTGAPTSPAILNIVFRGADRAFDKVAVRNNFTYTRYADDLTFSGYESPLRLLPFVRDVIGRLGLRLDENKTQIYRKGRRQIVTGLVVNEKPNLPRGIRKRLRAAVHRRTLGRQATWHGSPITDETLRGHLAYLQLVQPEEAKRFRGQLDGVSGGKV